MRASAALAALLLAWPAAAQAPDEAARRLREAEGGVARERASQAEAARATRAAAEAARRAEAERSAAITAWRRAEAEAGEAARRLAAAEGARVLAEYGLAERATRLAPLVPAMQRLSLYPAETLLVAPAPPAETLAALSVLRAAARDLAADAGALAAAAQAAAGARAAVEAENRTLVIALTAARARAQALDEAAEAARAARGEAAEAEAAQARRVAAAAAAALDLRGVVGRLEAAPPSSAPPSSAPPSSAAPPPSPAPATAARGGAPAPAGVARGSLLWPVRGPLVEPARTPGEEPGEGLAIAAAPGARVLAPCQGRVAFAAPFRTMGPLLILDCGDGYHVVLAGLERLDAAVGQGVRAGDPLGAMPTYDPRSGRRAILSMELRRAGRALDPGPFLSRQQDRIGG